MRPTEIRVRFHELDPYGHANHGVWLNWFETARIEIMEQLGFALTDLRDAGVHLVVTEATIRFHRPAMGGDLLLVESEVAGLRRATCWWHQRALRDGQVLADVDVRSGSVDPGGRAVPAPPALRDALQALAPVSVSA